MAGIIIADTIQSGGSFIRLNSASQTVATINSAGIYANTGNLLIAANGTIGVATIPNTAITGTMTQAQIGSGVATTGPAFSAFQSTSSINISNAVTTKVTLNGETFDTASCFDNSTNYRFTPNVAGYYQINACVYPYLPGSPSFYGFVYIYKNGSSHKQVGWVASGGNAISAAIQDLIYMNGTTDYLELYVNMSGQSGTVGVNGGSTLTFMSGFLARVA